MSRTSAAKAVTVPAVEFQEPTGAESAEATQLSWEAVEAVVNKQRARFTTAGVPLEWVYGPVGEALRADPLTEKSTEEEVQYANNMARKASNISVTKIREPDDIRRAREESEAGEQLAADVAEALSLPYIDELPEPYLSDLRATGDDGDVGFGYRIALGFVRTWPPHLRALHDEVVEILDRRDRRWLVEKIHNTGPVAPDFEIPEDDDGREGAAKAYSFVIAQDRRATEQMLASRQRRQDRRAMFAEKWGQVPDFPTVALTEFPDDMVGSMVSEVRTAMFRLDFVERLLEVASALQNANGALATVAQSLQVMVVNAKRDQDPGPAFRATAERGVPTHLVEQLNMLCAEVGLRPLLLPGKRPSGQSGDSRRSDRNGHSHRRPSGRHS